MLRGIGPTTNITDPDPNDFLSETHYRLRRLILEDGGDGDGWDDGNTLALLIQPTAGDPTALPLDYFLASSGPWTPLGSCTPDNMSTV